MPQIERVSEKVTTTILRLPKKDLLRALRSFREIHHEIVAAMESGRHIKIYMEVPGGADWSNMDLEVEDDQPLIIRYETLEKDDQPLIIRYETLEKDAESFNTEGK